MSKVVTEAVLNEHREAIELELCRRDYNLMAEHYPELLGQIEAAVGNGISPLQIKRWVRGIVAEDNLIQRCYNAARFIEAEQIT